MNGTVVLRYKAFSHGAASLLLAHYADRIDRRGKVLLWAVGAYGFATIAFGLSTSFWLTFACLAATGMADTVSIVLRNIIRQLRGQPLEPFRYRDQGTLATIGRNAAVANVFGVQASGFIAWVMWLGIHIIQLIGFRNKLFVLINWAWDYFFYERAARLITRD